MKNDIPVREIIVPDPHHLPFLDPEKIKNPDLTTKMSVLGLALAEDHVHVIVPHVHFQDLVVVLAIQDHAPGRIRREVADDKGIARRLGIKLISKLNSFLK